MRVIRQLNTRHIERHARAAIRERLKYDAPEALLGIERNGQDVIVRLNSGGNALAVGAWLRTRGYRAVQDGGNPGGYGCAVRVIPSVLGEVT